MEFIGDLIGMTLAFIIIAVFLSIILALLLTMVAPKSADLLSERFDEWLSNKFGKEG